MDDVPDEPDLMSDTDTESYSETDSCESESGGEVIVQTSDSDSNNEDVAASRDRSASEPPTIQVTAVSDDSPPALAVQISLGQEPEQPLEPAEDGRNPDEPRDRADSVHGTDHEADDRSDDGTQRSRRPHHSDDSASERSINIVARKPSRRRRLIKTRTITDHKTAGRYFQSGDYVSAEALYTKAITADPTAPLLYTNRAMARIKLGMFDGVVGDCEESLRLLPHNMKAWYYKSQALLAMGEPEEGLAAGKKAYEFAANSGDRSWERSLGNIVALVLKCKKGVWEQKEKQRQREEDPLQQEVLDMMEKEKNAELARISEGERGPAVEHWGKKIEDTKRVFAKARGEPIKREVPDWMIDDITFAIMVDPVIVGALPYLPRYHPLKFILTDGMQTKTGNSYERASIMEHLRRSHTDPLTRSPLEPHELRPNLALRDACEQFLEENGWAVDY